MELPLLILLEGTSSLFWNSGPLDIFFTLGALKGLIPLGFRKEDLGLLPEDGAFILGLGVRGYGFGFWPSGALTLPPLSLGLWGGFPSYGGFGSSGAPRGGVGLYIRLPGWAGSTGGLLGAHPVIGDPAVSHGALPFYRLAVL